MGLKEDLEIKEPLSEANYHELLVTGLPSKQVQFKDDNTQFTVSTQFTVFKSQDKIFTIHNPTRVTFFTVSVSSGHIVEPSFLADQKIEGTIDKYDEHNLVFN
ncbi:MAG: hypothetical protein ACP5HC_04930, partial [Caldisericum sp.]